jgi:hypothetical protein
VLGKCLATAPQDGEEKEESDQPYSRIKPKEKNGRDKLTQGCPGHPTTGEEEEDFHAGIIPPPCEVCK